MASSNAAPPFPVSSDPDDFLNAAAKHPNFLTGKPYSDTYKELAAKWSKLPMYSDKETQKNVISSIRDHPITLLISETGSGKSVFTPKFALKLARLADPQSKKKVAITIPKRVAVEGAALYGAKALNVAIGEEVDYAFRGKKASPTATLLYLTDGILLARILHGDAMLSAYSHVIIDEAHERPVPTDLLLYFLRNIVQQRPEFRVIIMSATIDPAPFVNYFSTIGAKPNIVHASGVTAFPIKRIYLKANPASPREALQIAVDNVVNTMKNTTEGDVLVFVPRIRDTLSGCMMLRDKLSPSVAAKTLCTALHASTEPEETQLAVHGSRYKERGFTRRVLFATNVAESSLTIDGIQYVYDTGLEVQVTWDAAKHATQINVDYTSQGQIRQRIGRTGRTGPGMALHLYSEARFNSLKPLPSPNITKVELTDQFLLMTSHFTVKQVINTFASLLTPPTVMQVVDAVAFLHFNGLIAIEGKAFDEIKYADIDSYEKLGKYDGSITPTGKLVLQAQEISPGNALLLLWGAVFGCLREMVSLACILETVGGDANALWSEPGLSAAVKKRVTHPTSEHITLINVYEQVYMKSGRATGMSSQWDRIHKKVGKFYRIFVDADTQTDLLRRAKLPGLTVVENALFAARCFNMVTVGPKQTLTNVYPLASTTGSVELGFPIKHAGATVGVYESLMISARGPMFSLITFFPGLKNGLKMDPK